MVLVGAAVAAGGGGRLLNIGLDQGRAAVHAFQEGVLPLHDLIEQAVDRGRLEPDQ